MDNRDELVQQVNLFLYLKNKSSCRCDLKVTRSRYLVSQGTTLGNWARGEELWLAPTNRTPGSDR